MRMILDGREICPLPGQSLQDMVRSLGLDTDLLSNRPLAAQMAGEVFTLNYVPCRMEEAGLDRPSVRCAVQASNGIVTLLRYSDRAGKELYVRTAQFLIFLSISQLWPKARAKMDCTVGNGLYVEVLNAPDFCVEALRQHLTQLVDMDFPLMRRRVSTEEAVARYTKKGQADKAKLLAMRQVPWFDEYYYGDFSDYYYGELAPSTGYLQVWDIVSAEGGFMFVFPDDQNPDSVAGYIPMPNFMAVCNEAEQWCTLMECENVADLNMLVKSGRVRELIRVNEALHEKRYSQVADQICHRGARIVMLAGPSSSGKTTSANRLATQLRVFGKKPILLSLDDYYIDRCKIQPGPDGKLDLEHIDTIDTQLFARHIQQLLAGESVEIPSFDFKSGTRQWKGHRLQLKENTVIIVEGLHALNPVMLPEGIARELVFKLYVSPLLPLNLDDHNRIPTSYLRLLRRIVRDYETRGASVEDTLQMWDSVRRGEKRWIFPFQEDADVIFNSSTLYELAVLKRHIYPLLLQIKPEQECFEQVRSIVKILNYVQEADVDDEIPPTSLVREFIGGNSFYK